MDNVNVESLATELRTSGVHTVEVAIVDTYGHLRGKRVPVEHFLGSVAMTGCHIADAIYIFDMRNDVVDSPYTNMALGFGDTHLMPLAHTMRVFSHRPGYAIVFADSLDEDHTPHFLAPRNVLQDQVDRCHALGYEPVVATELEFFLCDEEWEPVQSHIQYSSLTDAPRLEVVLAAIRSAMLGAGLPVESSNPEYGPGQIEINVAPTDAMTTADNTALYKSLVKEIAVEHGLRATFMAKPWAEQSGSGMHVHTSLSVGGTNAFASSADSPNELMGQWIAGQLAHAGPLGLVASPYPNGFRRLRPYTFAPTHACWALDNRSVLCRCTVGSDRKNRVEYRAAGSDANPYLLIAGLLAAGVDGIERQLDPGPIAVGDIYDEPGDHPALPADAPSAIEAFEGSALGAALGDKFSDNFVLMARAEVDKLVEAGGDPAGDAVIDWERDRFLEFT